MSTFFAVGIVLNVVLTGLALYWLWRQRMPKTDADDGRRAEFDREPDARAPWPEPDANNDYLAEHANLLIRSYRHWTGRHLIEPGHTARELYDAPFAVASHGSGEDPVFNYANRAALALFEAGWNQFTSTPSRLSAEPLEREERARLLERVKRQGHIDDYSGIRISATGRRIRIRRATVWNVMDAHGMPAGQAVQIHEWEYLSTALKDAGVFQK